MASRYLNVLPEGPIYGLRLSVRDLTLWNKITDLWLDELGVEDLEEREEFSWDNLSSSDHRCLDKLLTTNPDVKLLLQQAGYPAGISLFAYDFNRRSPYDEYEGSDVDLAVGWRLGEFPAVCYSPAFKKFLQTRHSFLGWLGV